MRWFFTLLFLAASLRAGTPDVREIMRRVSENVDKANAARAAWVYEHDTFVRLKRTNGKLAREESREYTVAPTEKGARRKLVRVEGKILNGTTEVPYDLAGYRQKEMDIDGAVVDSLSRELMWRRDNLGLLEYWDPLQAKNLDKYDYQLDGQERYRDYDVYRIVWRSKSKDDPWEGEALIDRSEFQPVLVTTAWKGKVPRTVAIGFGTNVKSLGAKITYKRFDEGVWFPVECGGELKVRFLFLYARTIAFSGANKDFHKTDVQSSIEFGGEAE